ncbi:ABC transporter substrate-binding protein [Arhodomonas sp. AD133]|uniref:ABC transporter substrate-binding protein n=1 Tax=Arhodomonas sp. AD133 TaxID=3415009 RepID=UPI003EBD50EE
MSIRNTDTTRRWPRWLAAVAAIAISQMTAAAEPVRLGTPPWPGATVKTEVAAQILEHLGYETETVNASTSILLKSISMDQLDAELAVWRPSQSHMLDPLLEEGTAVELARNIEGARYKIAVPKYVWEAGVHSLTDLAEHADKFGRTLYGIEAGNAGNEIMKKAIKDDTYDLDGWRVLPSSVSGMLAEVGKAVEEKRWIAFQAWEPHWMNITYDLKYLADPEGMWGDKSAVYTAARADLEAERPNVARFLSQMVVPVSTQSQWIYDHSYDDIPAERVAADWIAANDEIVAEWLDGVTTADGEQAAIEHLESLNLAEK